MTIRARLNCTNITYSASNGGGTGTWRWPDAKLPVPVWIAHVSPGFRDQVPLVNVAIDIINRRLGRDVLRLLARNEDSDDPILVWFGKSRLPDGVDPRTRRGSVSEGPGSDVPIRPGKNGEFAATPVHINLGNNKCGVELDHVIHEFGHALGLGRHFAGFGDAHVISEHFWNVLATLYGHPPGTLIDGIDEMYAQPA